MMNSNSTIQLPNKYYIPLYLIFISLLLFATRDFETAKSSPITLANAHRILSIILEIGIIVFYFINRGTIPKAPLLINIYSFYLLIGVVSTAIYSNQIFYDIWKILELLSLILLGMYIYTLSKNDIRIAWSFFEKTIKYIKFLLITVLISLIIDPSNAMMPMEFTEGALFAFRLQGTIVIINALSVGTLSAFILYYYIIKIIKTKKYSGIENLSWVFISITLLMLSQSRTSIFALLIALLLYVLFIMKISLVKRYFLILITSSIFALIFPLLILIMQRGSSDAVVTSLSGRTIWWAFAWGKYISSDTLHKLIGFGFASGERQIANQSSNGFMNTLDSTYLSSIVSTGALGTLAISIGFLVLNYLLIQHSKRQEKTLIYMQAQGISLMLFVKSFTTATINILTVYSLMFIILAILIKNRK